MLLHRKKESRDASSRSGDAVGRARGHAGRVLRHPEQERGAGQEAPQPQLDARLEAALGPPLRVEVEEHRQIALRDRPAVGAAGQGREDLPRAGGLVAGVGRSRAADEDAVAARRALGRPRPARLERTRDGDAADVRLIPCIAPGDARVRTQERLPQGLGIGGRLLMERHLHGVGTRPHRRPNLPAVVDRPLAGQVLAVLGAAARSRRRGLADGERLQRLAVQTHLEPVRGVERLQGARGVARELHANAVHRVFRERELEPGAAAGAERQPVRPDVLGQVGGEAERLGRRRGDRPPDGEAADLLGGRQVALEQGRRDAEHPRDVVEPVAAVVGRQQGRGVDVQRQQVANDVVVLAAVEPMEGVGTSRVGIPRRREVELGLEPDRERLVGRRVGTRPGGGGHGPGPQLPHHPSPRPRGARRRRPRRRCRGPGPRPASARCGRRRSSGRAGPARPTRRRPAPAGRSRRPRRRRWSRP